jgi:hypothetical protein
MAAWLRTLVYDVVEQAKDCWEKSQNGGCNIGL